MFHVLHTMLLNSVRLSRRFNFCGGNHVPLQLAQPSHSERWHRRSCCAQSRNEDQAPAPYVTTCTLQVNQEQSDSFADALMEYGAQAASVELGQDEAQGTCAVVAHFDGDMPQSRMQSIVEMSGRMAAVDSADLGCHWRQVSNTGWQEHAAECAYQPVRASDRLWVVPEHTAVPPEWHLSSGPDPTVVRVHARLAFGSGDHPTTRQCLQWLAQSDLRGCSVVDYGCGSGVLGIAARLLGAHEVVWDPYLSLSSWLIESRAWGHTGGSSMWLRCVQVGYDIDEQAVQASRENAQLNAATATCTFHLCSPQGLDPDSTPDRQFDICIANIFQADLLALRETFTGLVRRGGKIVMSGILAGTQAAAVTEAFERCGCSVSSRGLDGWAIVEAVRR